MNYEPSFALAAYYDPTVGGLADYQFPYSEEAEDTDSDSYYSLPVCDRNLGWSIDWATAFLVDYLTSKASEVKATIRKVHNRAVQFSQDGEWEHLAYRAFNTLNNTFFAGHLKDAVYLAHGRLGADVTGATYTHGQGPNRRVRRVSIVLNTDVLRGVSGPRLVSSLIHQMIHAYFLIACGPEQEKETAYGRLDHGVAFSKIANTINELCKSNGKNWLPSVDSTLRLRRRYVYDGDYYIRPPRQHDKEWYCSDCQINQSPIAVGDVEKWYGGICKPLLDLPEAARTSKVFIYNKREGDLEEVSRPETTPSGDSYQFIFEDKAILVPGSKVDAFLSIRRAFDKGGSVYIEVDKDTKKDGFMAVLEVLHTGTYSPDITPVTGGRGGPPIIRPMRVSSPNYLMKDITVFKTALEMGFDDLLGLAIGRMRAQTVTHEDPVAILEAIYEGTESPHGDIRQWAKDFLVKGGMDLSDWSLSRQPDLEPPNLVKLKTEMCFRERFIDLCNRCGALHIDVLMAEESLIREGRVGQGRVSPKRGLGLGGYALPAVSPPPLGISFGVDVGVAPPPSRGLGLGAGMGMGWRGEGPEGYLRYIDMTRNVGPARLAHNDPWGWP